MLGQCLHEEVTVAGVLVVQIVAENVPEIAVDRAGVFGADVAGVRVDVELDQTQMGTGTGSWSPAKRGRPRSVLRRRWRRRPGR